MTDAELIKTLRSSANRVVNYAGDRIEQLTAERDRQYDENVHRIAMQAKAEAERDRLRALLAEAASDLTAYVDAEYPPDTCAQYPDIAKRHFRDMDLVRRIEAEIKGGQQ